MSDKAPPPHYSMSLVRHSYICRFAYSIEGNACGFVWNRADYGLSPDTCVSIHGSGSAVYSIVRG